MHASFRPRHAVLIAVLALVATSGRELAGRIPQPDPVAEAIKRVQDRIAPDTRVSVFDIKAATRGTALEVTGEVDGAAAREAVLQALRDVGRSPVVDKIVVLPDPQFAARPLGVVTVSVAVMKTRASHESELASQLLMGSVVRILKRNGWYYVQSLDDRYLGWMEPDHLALMAKADVEAFEHAPRVVVVSPYAWVRSQPSGDAPPVCDSVIGDIFRTTGRAGDFLTVQLPDLRTGYVSQHEVSDYADWKAARRVTADTVEQTARLFMGVPYLWGGTSVKGFDCSGFVKIVFHLNGLELQRDADQQADEGAPVALDPSFSQVRRGDVLFFGPRPGAVNITHTGIYLGAKLFIHCAGLVKLNSFDPASPLYNANLLGRLVKVRRMSFPPHA